MLHFYVVLCYNACGCYWAGEIYTKDGNLDYAYTVVQSSGFDAVSGIGVSFQWFRMERILAGIFNNADYGLGWCGDDYNRCAPEVAEKVCLVSGTVASCGVDRRSAGVFADFQAASFMGGHVSGRR